MSHDEAMLSRRTLSQKVAFASANLTAIILFSAYSALLTSTMTSTPTDFPIKRYEDVPKHGFRLEDTLHASYYK